MVTESKLGACKYCGSPYHRGWQCIHNPKRKKTLQKVTRSPQRHSTKKDIMSPISKKKVKQTSSGESKKSLIKKADRVFSLYLRKKAKKNPYCFICHKPLKYEQMVCLHFISRRFLSVRWNEDNVHVGCIKCNTPDIDQPEVLRKYASILGEDTVNHLNSIKNNKVYDFEIKEIYEKYKKLEKELQ